MFSLRPNVLLSLTVVLFSIQETLSEQQPFVSPRSSDQWWHKSELESYTFPWPIQKVAIIGAGPSGLAAYHELDKAGYDVYLFERDTVPGGNWHYTDETPVKEPIPNADVSVGDFVPSLPPEGARLPYEEHYEGNVSDEMLRAHRGPKPIWNSLQTNAPPPLQQFRDHPWPADQPWLLPHAVLGKYIRAFASFNGINSNDVENPHISYNTRVELVEKCFTSTENGPMRTGWTLTLKQVSRTGTNTSKAVWTKENFDAVVVATGRFNAPYIPNILGLKAWADRFPDRIVHSRQFRRPQSYTNKTVLVVGAAASGVEIATDIAPNARAVYLSIRSTKSGNPLSSRWMGRLPHNVSVVPEIKRFLPPTSTMSLSDVELTNGTILTGIESIIFATGFRYTFPFLPQFHNTSLTNLEHKLKPIVTDGTHLRNLFLDILSIEEPTLGFMCMNIEIQNFKYAEYIAVALSKIWGNKATIPSVPLLWELNERRVSDKGGYGKYFQFLGFRGEREMIRLFTGWLNDAAASHGGRQVDVEPSGDFELIIYWFLAYYGVDVRAAISAEDSTNLDPRITIPFGWNRPFSTSSAERERIEKRIDDLLYGYDW